MVRRVVGACCAALIGLSAAIALPSPVIAHSLAGRLESPLPLEVYLAGAGMAVALSFAFVIVRDVRAPAPSPGRLVPVPPPLVVGLRTIGLVAWLWIVAQTIVGGSSSADVGTLFLWIYGWVGLAIVSALVGPVWSWLDPFSTLHDLAANLLRRVGVGRTLSVAYPTRLGSWPAVAGLAFFVWLELVYQGRSVGLVLVGYTAITLAAMAVFGRDAWRRHGETFSVWLGTLNRLAIVGLAGEPGGRTVRRRPFVSGVLEPGWTTAHVVLVAIGVASVMYDGLSQTQVWADLFGLLDLPGSTIELLVFLAVVVGLALAVGRSVGTAAVGAGLVPIAIGYIVAHYLTYLLGDGQLIVVAISDPLQLGWDLFGTAFYVPGTAWLPASIVWTMQLASVVGGHIVGAWAGHVVAVRDARAGVDVRLRQVPLAALMVCLTVVTLWSLGQEIVRTPTATAPPDPPASAPQAESMGLPPSASTTGEEGRPRRARRSPPPTPRAAASAMLAMSSIAPERAAAEPTTRAAEATGPVERSASTTYLPSTMSTGIVTSATK
jgi:hypothetical protein